MIHLRFGTDQRFTVALPVEAARKLLEYLQAKLGHPHPPDPSSPAQTAQAVAKAYGTGVR